MPTSTGPSTKKQRPVWPLPLGLTLVFIGLSFTRHVQENSVLVQTIWVSAALLLMWQIALFRSSSSRRPVCLTERVSRIDQTNKNAPQVHKDQRRVGFSRTCGAKETAMKAAVATTGNHNTL